MKYFTQKKFTSIEMLAVPGVLSCRILQMQENIEARSKAMAKRLIRFTLIELLVVIAIISILMTILMPALKNARALSKQISCTSNLKQIGIIFTTYCGDQNGCLPPIQQFYPAAGPDGYKHFWGRCLWDVGLIKENKSVATRKDGTKLYMPHSWCFYKHAGEFFDVLRCPVRSADKTTGFFTMSYSLSRKLPDRSDSNATEWTTSAIPSRISKPTRRILVAESAQNEFSFDSCNNDGYRHVSFPHNAADKTLLMGKGNFLFLDGHVKAYTHNRLLEANGGLEGGVMFSYTE